ncbi:MAG TPA: cyclase [Trebonia sp.]
MRSFRLETAIAAPVGDCFELSLSVDAHAASMRAAGERAVGGVTSGVMGPGDTVTWQARHFGIVFRMTSAITEYAYPSRFVEFRSPLGLAGAMADRLVLGRYMPRLLRQRNAWLKATLEARS